MSLSLKHDIVVERGGQGFTRYFLVPSFEVQYYCISPSPSSLLNSFSEDTCIIMTGKTTQYAQFQSVGIVAATRLPQISTAGNETFSRGVYYDGVLLNYSFGIKSHKDCLQECIKYNGVSFSTYNLPLIQIFVPCTR